MEVPHCVTIQDPKRIIRNLTQFQPRLDSSSQSARKATGGIPQCPCEFAKVLLGTVVHSLGTTAKISYLCWWSNFSFLPQNVSPLYKPPLTASILVSFVHWLHWSVISACIDFIPGLIIDVVRQCAREVMHSIWWKVLLLAGTESRLVNSITQYLITPK